MRHFKIGQRVRYYPIGRTVSDDERTCIVVAMLPEKDGGFEYKIRSIDDHNDRTAKESEVHNIRYA